jgi:uncharacterized membrane protein
VPQALRIPAFLLGFALGGFFDGILFHQVLQWHHLLSLWAPAETLEFQVLWDGMFHAAHYAIAAVGLWLLWRRRRAAAEAGAGRVLAGWAWLGFGVWHLLDVVLNHWILAMHRARIGVENPLAWDMIFVALGIAGLAIGWLVLRRQGSDAGGGAGGAVAAGLAGLLLLSAPIAALPPRDAGPEIAALLEGRMLPAFCAGWTIYDAR